MYETIEVATKNAGYRRLIIGSAPEGKISIHTPDGPVEGFLAEWLYKVTQKSFEERVRMHAKNHSVDWGLFRRYDWEERISEDEE